MPYEAMNATVSGFNTIGTPGTWLPLFATIILAATILIVFMTSKKFYTLVMWTRNTFGYFFYGLSTAIIFGSLYYVVRGTVRQVQSGNPWLLKWVGIILAAYLVLTGVGYAVKHWVLKPVRTNWKKAKKEYAIKIEGD